MRLSSGTTVVENGQLVDGNGGPPIARGRLIIRDGLIAFAGAEQAAHRRAARRGENRRPRRHDHAGAGRGPLPPHVLQRRRAGRSRYQVSGGVRDAAGGGQCAAGARMWLHGGAQRRQPAQHRRVAEKSDRRRPLTRTSAGRERSRDLRRRRPDGLEPRLSQDRHGRAGAAGQRSRPKPARQCASW